MGAKYSTLEFLRNRCAGHIHSLGQNHRSPKYLLDLFNTYAAKELGIAEELLPSTSYHPTTIGNELQLVHFAADKAVVCPFNRDEQSS